MLLRSTASINRALVAIRSAFALRATFGLTLFEHRAVVGLKKHLTNWFSIVQKGAMNGPLSATFSALSDETRRDILGTLVGGDATASDLASPHAMTLSGVMKHLRVLEEAGLLTREKRGRTVWCRLNAAPLRDVVDWATRYRAFWEEQFDSLAAHLERQSQKDEPR
jgi:DNA-binding transcriptional ArsR family regulator